MSSSQAKLFQSAEAIPKESDYIYEKADYPDITTDNPINDPRAPINFATKEKDARLKDSLPRLVREEAK